jgi:hypothetical protein
MSRRLSPSKRVPMSPIYEEIEDTASREYIQYKSSTGCAETTARECDDGVRCIWRCPKCKQAMQIGSVARIMVGNILTVHLTCANKDCPGEVVP